MDERVEIRCPGRYRKLFLVLTSAFLPDAGKYMEIACYDCVRDKKRSGEPVASVFHYYDSTGKYAGSKKTLDL